MILRFSRPEPRGATQAEAIPSLLLTRRSSEGHSLAQQTPSNYDYDYDYDYDDYYDYDYDYDY